MCDSLRLAVWYRQVSHMSQVKATTSPSRFASPSPAPLSGDRGIGGGQGPKGRRLISSGLCQDRIACPQVPVLALPLCALLCLTCACVHARLCVCAGTNLSQTSRCSLASYMSEGSIPASPARQVSSVSASSPRARSSQGKHLSPNKTRRLGSRSKSCGGQSRAHRSVSATRTPSLKRSSRPSVCRTSHFVHLPACISLLVLPPHFYSPRS